MKALLLMLAFTAVLAMVSCSGSKDAASDKPKDEYTTLPSGLKYKDLKIGDGPEIRTGQKVTVHYTGKLQDGTVFDSSVERNLSFDFTIGRGQVIKGWDEGVLSMRVGGKRILIIPPDLGYGTRAVGKIPANSTLTFEVEVLGAK